MADALCGPSNALQNFQKHTSVDRTLQQDRLVSRQSPAQGFRSSPATNIGGLDFEFEAFQAGHSAPAPPPSHLHHFSPPPAHFHAPSPAAAPLNAPGWAADFQRLNISSPAPATPLNTFRPPPTAQVSNTSWHQAFLNQQTSTTPHQMQTVPSHITPGISQYGQYGGMYQPPQAFGNVMGQQSEVALGKQRAQEVAVPAFDEAAFERAFDAAQAEILAAETNMLNEQKPMSDANVLATDETAPLEATRIEEVLEAAERNEEAQRPHDDDELAQTAGQLLDSLAHETDKKFQESTFLALMRRLRDHEVRVADNKIVETVPSDADLGRGRGITASQDTVDHVTGELSN